MKRILALLLSCLLVLGIFAACTPDTPDTDLPGSDNPGSDVSVSDSGSETQNPGNTDTNSTDTSVSTEKKSAQEILEAQEQHLVGLCDQKQSRIIVCDLNVEDWNAESPIVWEYKHWTCGSVAGLKLRHSEVWNKDVVIYCYAGGACIIDYTTKEMLFETTRAGGNPHSVELLPDNTFIVASSTDNKVSVFSAETVESGSGQPCQTLEYPNAHGVLWDPKYEVVWMEGMNQLGAYGVIKSSTSPKLAADPDMVYETPDYGLHDLAPVYGDPDGLFVTCSAGILKFNKVEGKFTTGYPGGNVGKKIEYAPGTGNFGVDNVFVYTSITESTMVYTDWCTDTVFIYVPGADGIGKTVRRQMNDSAFYKVRVWNTDYQ